MFSNSPPVFVRPSDDPVRSGACEPTDNSPGWRKPSPAERLDSSPVRSANLDQPSLSLTLAQYLVRTPIPVPRPAAGCPDCSEAMDTTGVDRICRPGWDSNQAICPVEAIGLLHKDRPAHRVLLLQIQEHLVEVSSTSRMWWRVAAMKYWWLTRRQMEGPKKRERKNDSIDAHKLARVGRMDPQSLSGPAAAH